MRQGLSPEEARWAAQRSFGGVAQTREAHRDVRSFLWLEDLARDVRYARADPPQESGFTATSVATLALAIGANTAMFSVLNACCSGRFLIDPRSSWRCCGPRIRVRTFAKADRHLGCRRVAASEPELRGHGGLRSCVRDADGRGRGGTDQRRQGLTQLLSAARRSARAGAQLLEPRRPSSGSAWP